LHATSYSEAWLCPSIVFHGPAMATTMRGFLRLGLRPPNFHWSSSGPLTACNLSRPLHLLQTHLRCTFTTSSCQWAAMKSRLPHSVSSTAFKSVLPYKSPFNAYTEQLANRASPTLLYEAPSHNFYNTGWLLMGAFCLTWAIINFKHQYLHPVEGTPKFIPYMMGAACVGMMFGAGWSFSKVSIYSLIYEHMQTDRVARANHSHYNCYSVIYWLWASFSKTAD